MQSVAGRPLMAKSLEPERNPRRQPVRHPNHSSDAQSGFLQPAHQHLPAHDRAGGETRGHQSGAGLSRPGWAFVAASGGGQTAA